VKNKETGLRKSVEINKCLREWWFKTDQGKVCVSIKSAVEAGELDTQIATASITLRKGFNKWDWGVVW